jgi:hypothetical protein
MISRPQRILVKRAQKEAGLPDEEYRAALQTVCQCSSTTDPRMTDRDVDVILAYFEAIYYRAVDAGILQPVCKLNAVFQQRGYWAKKNPKAETSRDRFCKSQVDSEVDEMERAMAELGFGKKYCDGIKERVTQGRSDARSLFQYKTALSRTLESKRRAVRTERIPF